MPDLTHAEAMEMARKRHGAVVADNMHEMIEAGERMQQLVLATGITVDEVRAAFESLPHIPGEAERIANAVIMADERNRPIARLRRLFQRTFG